MSETAFWIEPWSDTNPSSTRPPAPFIHNASGIQVTASLVDPPPAQVIAGEIIALPILVRVDKPKDSAWGSMNVKMMACPDNVDVSEESLGFGVRTKRNGDPNSQYFIFENITFPPTLTGQVMVRFDVRIKSYTDGADDEPPAEFWPMEEKPDESVANLKGPFNVGELIVVRETQVLPAKEK